MRSSGATRDERRRVGRGTAALALLGVLLQAVLLPLVHRPPAIAATMAAVGEAPASDCHGRGDADHSGHGGHAGGGDELPTGAKPPHCPICLLLQASAVILAPALPDFAFPRVLSGPPWDDTSIGRRAGSEYRPAQARAPPA